MSDFYPSQRVSKALKRFKRRHPENYDLVNWFVAGKCESNLSPQDVITHKEFEAMLKACQNSRDRAMLSLLYETGARIGEIAAMRIEDVIFNDY